MHLENGPQAKKRLKSIAIFKQNTSEVKSSGVVVRNFKSTHKIEILEGLGETLHYYKQVDIENEAVRQFYCTKKHGNSAHTAVNHCCVTVT